ncbi:hypothetical protein T12_13292 [Trichinella patagoniensis]|uniref:Uncharacterized protein n=1 Tax=Trichinella patagoniensis TaxID=990121 RepID=A0A0V0ZRY5_9BILA|nr:hypothetical protein T12_13292 [Trichinella patagoniensis]
MSHVQKLAVTAVVERELLIGKFPIFHLFHNYWTSNFEKEDFRGFSQKRPSLYIAHEIFTFQGKPCNPKMDFMGINRSEIIIEELQTYPCGSQFHRSEDIFLQSGKLTSVLRQAMW